MPRGIDTSRPNFCTPMLGDPANIDPVYPSFLGVVLSLEFVTRVLMERAGASFSTEKLASNAFAPQSVLASVRGPKSGEGFTTWHNKVGTPFANQRSKAIFQAAGIKSSEDLNRLIKALNILRKNKLTEAPNLGLVPPELILNISCPTIDDPVADRKQFADKVAKMHYPVGFKIPDTVVSSRLLIPLVCVSVYLLNMPVLPVDQFSAAIAAKSPFVCYEVCDRDTRLEASMFRFDPETRKPSVLRLRTAFPNEGTSQLTKLQQGIPEIHQDLSAVNPELAPNGFSAMLVLQAASINVNTPVSAIAKAVNEDPELRYLLKALDLSHEHANLLARACDGLWSRLPARVAAAPSTIARRSKNLGDTRGEVEDDTVPVPNSHNLRTQRTIPTDGYEKHVSNLNQILGTVEDDPDKCCHRLLNYPTKYLPDLSGLGTRDRKKFNNQLAHKIDCSVPIKEAREKKALTRSRLDQPAPGTAHPAAAAPATSTDLSDDELEQQRLRRDLAEQKRMRKIDALMSQGFYKKAIALLSSERTSFIEFKYAKEKLDLLHPKPLTGEDSNLTLVSTHVVEFVPKEVESMLRKQAKGAAPGFSGLTEEHLVEAVRKNPVALANLTKLLAHIANNKVKKDLRDRLTRCRLIALPKVRNGKVDGVRPIAIGECLLKLANALVLKQLKGQQEAIFGELQLGLGRKHGADKIVHLIRKHVEEGKLLIALDATNGFNTPSRSAIKRRLAAETSLEPLYHLWNLSYASPSELVYVHRDAEQPHVVLSRRGTRQGCPLGAFLFALVIHDIIKEASEKFNVIAIRAYIDDISIILDNTEVAVQVAEFFKDRFSKIGIQLNPKKCEWYGSKERFKVPEYDANSKRHWLNDFIQEYEKPKGAIKVLGAYYCPDRKRSEELLFDHIKKTTDTSLGRLRDFNSPHKMTLLYHCIPSLMSYAIRMHHPSTSDRAAKYFDDEVEKLWCDFAEVKAAQHTIDLAMLPTRHGGCGITRSHPLRFAAYTASFNAAFDLPGESQKQGTERLYRYLCERVDKDPLLRQHRQDVAVSGNETWFSQTKDTNVRQLTTAQSAASLRARLATPHHSIQDNGNGKIQCLGCKAMIPAVAFNQHARGCVKIKGQNGSQAHAIGKIEVKKLAATLGIHAESKEPDFAIVKCPSCNALVDVIGEDWVDKHAGTDSPCDRSQLAAARKMRPDIRFPMAGSNAVIDLTLTGSIELKSPALGHAKRLLAKRTKIKDANYKERVERLNSETFFPVVSTCNGTLGAATEQFLKLLYDHRSDEKALLTLRTLHVNFKRIVHSISAGALINAERAHGAVHLRQINEEGDRSWNEYFNETFGVEDDTDPTPPSTPTADSTSFSMPVASASSRVSRRPSNNRISDIRLPSGTSSEATATQ